MESWAAAARLGIIREALRRDDLPFLDRPRHGDLPDEWDDSVDHELALALATSVKSAGRTTYLAWDLGARLPGINRLLTNGTLTLSGARLVSETFELLSDEDAARAEGLLLPHLTGPTRKTYGQILNLAARIAVEVDPGHAERRRRAAVKHGSRVRMYREKSGAAGLTGRDLPTDETLAAYANVNARAAEYKNSGGFTGAGMDQLRSTAYLDLLNDVTADERIAYGELATESKADAGTNDDAETNDGAGADIDYDDDPPAEDSPDESARPGASGAPESDCPCRECDGSCLPPDDCGPDDSSGPDGSGPGGGLCDCDPDGCGPCAGGLGDSGGSDSGSGPRVGSGDCCGRGEGAADDPDKAGLDGGEPCGDDGPGTSASPSPSSPRSPSAFLTRGPIGRSPALTDLVLPLVTLLGLAERPGEGHGLGPLDPELCRSLAALAVISPHTTVCVTVTDSDGVAIGHGCVRLGRRSGPLTVGWRPPLVALPARLNLSVTAARLAELAGKPGRLGGPAPPAARAPDGWALSPRGIPNSPGPPGDPDWCGTWALTLPSGLECTVRLEPVPTLECDHRHESHGYQPNDTLRHLVQIRDHSCTFPPCSRHARESDFEHAVPYHKGGRTCSCNAGARSRKCHRIKQSPGWKVTQPRPGWHLWTTPSGRSYVQEPWRYPI